MKKFILLFFIAINLFGQDGSNWTPTQKQFARKGDISDSLAKRKIYTFHGSVYSDTSLNSISLSANGAVTLGGYSNTNTITEVTGQNNYRLTVGESADYSTTMGGDNINNGLASHIISTHTKITSTSTHSGVFGGSNAYLDNSNYTLKLGGTTISNGTKDVIDSIMSSNYATMISTRGSKILNSRNAFMGSIDLSLISSSIGSFIFSGSKDTTTDSYYASMWNAVECKNSNADYGIINGFRNYNNGSDYNSIYNGYLDTINTSYKYNSIVNGQENKSTGYMNLIGGGLRNKANGYRQTIINGYDNILPSGADQTSILAGNSIQPTVAKDDMGYVGNLSIWETPTALTSPTQILVRDPSAEGEIKYSTVNQVSPIYITVLHTEKDSTIKEGSGISFIPVTEEMRGRSIKVITAALITPSPDTNLQIHTHVVDTAGVDIDISSNIYLYPDERIKENNTSSYTLLSTAAYIYFYTDRDMNAKGLAITVKIK